MDNELIYIACSGLLSGLATIIASILGKADFTKDNIKKYGCIFFAIFLLLSICVILIGYDLTRTVTVAATSTNTSLPTINTEASIDEIVPPSTMETTHDITPEKTIYLGNYRASKDERSDKEKIEWIVLHVEENKMLVVSRYGLDTQPFHSKKEKTTWKDSNIRKWLEKHFYYEAFSDEERSRILLTDVFPDETVLWDCDLGSKSSDHIFLLSYDEVKEYVYDDSMMKCSPTDSLKTQDIYVNSKGNGWW